MPAILYGFLGIWRRYFPTVAALVSLAIGVACNVAAEEPKHVRITLGRSVSAIPLWGIGPFAENAGFRVEYISSWYKCRHAAQSAERHRAGHIGLSKPRGHGRAERHQHQDNRGRAIGWSESDHAQGD